MTPIFLASVTPYVGKNVVTLGLATKFRSENRKVGVFKPIGPLPIRAEGRITDEDALFFHRALKLSEPLEQICPIVLDDQTIADMLNGMTDARERIMRAWNAVSEGKDVMLVAGMGRLSSGHVFGYSLDSMIRETKGKVIIVARYQWPGETLDGIMHMKDLMPDHIAGVIFNRIPPSRFMQVTEGVRKFLKKYGVETLGIIADDVVLNAVPLTELVENLDGKVLCAADRLDQLAEHFSIGAMQADAALRFFQRVPNKAVITGGDRADIQLAALQTSTRCLILTGDLYPNERILVRAEELGVPVILVQQDTSATAEICERLRGHLTLHSDHKISRANELVDSCLDWKLVHKVLGL